MPEIQVFRAQGAYADIMAPHIRQADRDEIAALTLKKPEEALRMAVESSSISWAGFVGSKIVCLFGVGPYLEGVGMPWLIGTDALELNSKSFLRQCVGFIKQMHEAYPVLENYVDVRNEASIRWLKWLGFTICDPGPYGVQGLPFHRFNRVQ